MHHQQNLGIGGLRGANVANVRQTKHSPQLAAFSSSSHPCGNKVSSAESFESRPKSRAQQSVEDWLLLVGRGDIYRFGASKVDADGVGDDDQETDDQDGIVEVACSLNTQKTANSGGIRFEESGHAEIRVSTAKKNARGKCKHRGWPSMAAVFLFVTTCQTHDDNLLEKKTYRLAANISLQNGHNGPDDVQGAPNCEPKASVWVEKGHG